ncbi:hypothetical protein [Candidatus Accumulibacter contiguus]|uniref:hypothetical protein n=1 Tax=Candidatus Accumulibacter contiguus TaxID=2954381 RepID=UPI002FC348FF
MVDLDAVLLKDDVLRRAANIDIVVGQVGEIADALGELLVQGCGFSREVSGKNLDWERKHG